MKFVPIAFMTTALVASSGAASAQERTFDCDENSVTGRSLSIRVTGPDTITAGPLRGTTMSMVQSGSNRFSFSGGPYRVTISEDQSRVIVRAPGSERIDCTFSAGTRQLKAAVENDDTATIKTVLEQLQQALYAAGAAVYQQAGATSGEAPGGNGDGASAAAGSGADDVIDAEFTETK